MMRKFFSQIVLLSCLLMFFASPARALEDDAGQSFDFTNPPTRIVSLLPSMTEIIRALGAGDALAGVTYNDSRFAERNGMPFVGGAFAPNYEAIRAIKPDLILLAPRDFEQAKEALGSGTYRIFVVDDAARLAKAEGRLEKFGEMLHKQAEAERIVAENREMMETIRRKVEKIPSERRKRVMYLAASSDGVLLTAVTDSFQADYIRAAGGIPIDVSVQGRNVVPVTEEMWRDFDPQIVYTSGADTAKVREILAGEPWRSATAVKEDEVHSFPGSLVCRASTHMGYFTAWLASVLCTDEFGNVSNLIYPQEIVSERPVELDVPYVKRARIVETRHMDFLHRTLLVDFKSPQKIITTMEGEREGILTVGNSFGPTPMWRITHKLGFEGYRDMHMKTLGVDLKTSDIMGTGADMNNLSIKTASYRDMKVTVLATAGVESNALRAGRDEGRNYEAPGTINIMVMTNRQLGERAAAGAVLVVTEAKTAALWDMDIRSAQTPLVNPATGTGTDTVIIVPGEGAPVKWSSGHSKIGQLIGEAVYAAVQDALLKQNGKTPVRSIFERLGERRIQTYQLTDGMTFSDAAERQRFQTAIEETLRTPRYAAFVEAALSLSDARTTGQLSNLDAFESWAKSIAGELAGKPVARVEGVVALDDLPPPLRIALDAIATGLRHRDGK